MSASLILGGLLMALVARQVWELLPRLSKRVIWLVTRPLPGELRDEREEEWTEVLESRHEKDHLFGLLWSIALSRHVMWESATHRRAMRSAAEDLEASGVMEFARGDVMEACEALTGLLRMLAIKHRKVALATMLTWSASAALIPVVLFISPEGFVLGQVLPSLLGIAAALAVAAERLVRPRENWRKYALLTDTMSFEAMSYTLGVGDYADPGTRDGLLAERIQQARMGLHEDRRALFPPSP